MAEAFNPKTAEDVAARLKPALISEWDQWRKLKLAATKNLLTPTHQHRVNSLRLTFSSYKRAGRASQAAAARPLISPQPRFISR